MKNINKQFKYILEFLPTWVFVKLFTKLPMSAVSRMSMALGWLLARLPASVHTTAKRNLKRVFPHWSEEDILHVSRLSAQHMVQTFLETPQIYNAPSEHITKWLTIEGESYLDAHPNALILTAHFGCWEIILRYLADRGWPFCAVYRKANNPFVDKLIQEMRAHPHITLAPKGKAGSRLLLKAAKNNQPIGFLNDQKLNDGIDSKLLNQKVKSAPAFANIALKTGQPILPVFCYRTGMGYYTLEVHPPIPVPTTGTESERIHALVQAYNDVLSTVIRTTPEQWMWQHKRFT